MLTAQKYKYNQEEILKDRYNTFKHCPFYHKDVPNGFNLYLAEQYINPVPLSTNIYYWLRIHKHLVTNVSFNKDRSAHKLYLLLLGGIEPNPGPRRPRFPCGICGRACKTGVIACDDCDKRKHNSCLGMKTAEFSDVGRSDEKWSRPSCSKPNNSSSISYHVPDTNTTKDNPIINVSLHPSRLDSVSEQSSLSSSSLSTSTNSIETNIQVMSPLRNTTPIMTSSPIHNTTRNVKSKQRKSLRILVINFRSLRKKGKLLEALVETTNADIIMGIETWLDPNIKSSEIFPEYQHFDIARRDRPSGPHGGVIIIAKKLHLGDVSLSKNLEMISGTIKLEGRKKMVLVTYYSPPHQTDETINRLRKQEIMELRNKHKKDILVLAGDFNLHDINWSEQTISSNQYTVGTNQTYLDIASYNGIEHIVDFPTRNENTLDLIFTSHPSYKQRCKPIPAIENSDHDIVLLDIACNPIKPKPTRHKISLWKKAHIYKIQEDLIVFS